MRHKALIAAIVLDLGVSVLVLAARKAGMLSEAPYKGFVNVNMVLTATAAALFAVDALRRGPRDRTAMGLLAGALSLLAMGEAACLLQDWLLASRDWSAPWYDLSWLAARGLVLVLLVRGVVVTGPRPPLGAAAATGAGALAVVAVAVWASLLPLARGRPLLDIADLSVPMLAADLAAIGIFAAAFARGGVRPVLFPLCGVVAVLCTDILLYRDVATDSGAFCLGEMGYFGGYLLAAWGTARIAARGATAPR